MDYKFAKFQKKNLMLNTSEFYHTFKNLEI